MVSAKELRLSWARGGSGSMDGSGVGSRCLLVLPESAMRTATRAPNDRLKF